MQTRRNNVLRVESAQICTNRRKVNWGETNLTYLIVLLWPTQIYCCYLLYKIVSCSIHWNSKKSYKIKKKAQTADWFLKSSRWKGWVVKHIYTYKMKLHVGDIKSRNCYNGLENNGVRQCSSSDFDSCKEDVSPSES